MQKYVPSDIDAYQRWVVLNTHPHREEQAVDNLRRQNFEVYCPRIRKRVRHARKTAEVMRPLFPGYLFVSVDKTFQLWRPLLSTVGVRTLIRTGNSPSYLDPDFVAALKAREVDGAVVSRSVYVIGQQITFVGGAFDGMIATIIEMQERDRLVVLLNMIQSQIKVHVPSDAVEPASRHNHAAWQDD